MTYNSLMETVDNWKIQEKRLFEDTNKIIYASTTSKTAQAVKQSLPKSHPLRAAIVLAMLAGLFLLASGVTSGSILITARALATSSILFSRRAPATRARDVKFRLFI